MSEHSIRLAETTQHMLPSLSGQTIEEYTAMRACVPHSLAFVEERAGALDVAGYLDFIATYGPHLDENGVEQGSAVYEAGRGWHHMKLADLLRLQGNPVVVQNLQVEPETTDEESLRKEHRIVSDFEREMAEKFDLAGGKDRRNWGHGLILSLAGGATPIPVINVPSMVHDGFGGHAVAVLGIDNKTITYYDSDANWAARYSLRELTPLGTPVDPASSELIFTAPLDDFVLHMSGGVLHVWPPVSPQAGEDTS